MAGSRTIDEGEAAGLGPEAVLAIDNIALDLPIAGLGSRALAATIDYALMGLLLMVVVLVTLGVLVTALQLAAGWVVAILLVLVFAVNWGYFAGFEVATRGRTPGKMAVRLRVVGRTGGTPSAGALVVRNLLRDVDLVVGLPMIATDALARRLGDRVAGTLVVHDRPAATEVLLGRVPAGWGAREVALAESYLRRSAELEEERRLAVGRRLLALVARDAPELAAEVARYGDPELALRRALEVREQGAG
jgi:uncharacterized RDD family membrane protein YckC